MMPYRRTQQDPELLSRPTAAESQTCAEQGQRLDAARAEFRVEWQAKIDRKRRQAEAARRLGAGIMKAQKVLTEVIAFFGAVAGVAQGGKSLGLPGLLVGALGGAVAGYAIAFLASGVAGLARSACLRSASRAEQAAGELECS